MRLLKLEVNNCKVLGTNIYNFENSKVINTVSGKNGSGKTTIFSIIALVQKAFFFKLIESLDENEFDKDSIQNSIETDLSRLFEKEGRAELKLVFEEKDFMPLGTRAKRVLFDKKKNSSGEFIVSVELRVHKEKNEEKLERSNRRRFQEKIVWGIYMEDDEAKVLKAFWSLDDPRCIITYVPAERIVYEKDMNYEDVRLRPEAKFSNKLNVIFGCDGLFNSLYSSMLISYVHERIIPSKRRNKKDRFVADSKKMFAEIFPNKAVLNFSGIEKQNQFILNASDRETKSKYDIRYFSSGEKLVWYTIILLNYIEQIGVLIIDEPENHLHETLLWSFVEMLRKLSYTNGDTSLDQVFLLTHSKNLIYNNFSKGINYVLMKNMLVELSYEACEAKLRELGISYIDEKVLFVEGDTEEKILGDILSDYNIKIRQLANCSDIIRTYEGVQGISEYVQDKRIVFLLDKDTREDSEIELLRSKNPVYFDEHVVFLNKHEIENYFLDVSVVMEAYNSMAYFLKKEEKQREEINDILRTAADESLEETKKKHLNYLLYNELRKMSSCVKKKEIKVKSKNQFDEYIESLINNEMWLNLSKTLKGMYVLSEEKYSSDNWGKDWGALCDGKVTFNKAVSGLAKELGVSFENLKERIIISALENKASDLSKLIETIINLYD